MPLIDELNSRGGTMSYSMNDSSDSGAPKRGRPKRGQGPGVPWQEVDQLLVLGEDVLNEKTGRPEVKYPTYRELSSRYGVSASLIATYAAKHQCMKRREENIARTQAQFEQKLIEKRAQVLAMSGRGGHRDHRRLYAFISPGHGGGPRSH
jgi:hypothetical protein